MLFDTGVPVRNTRFDGFFSLMRSHLSRRSSHFCDPDTLIPDTLIEVATARFL